ncbi:MAG TPA: hypothetical protein DEP91_01170 [Sphingomonas bacterium]|jgi:hypothetical protein|uniref:Integrase n=1 Tax=Sphingomonas bacterium TaxID=1895847 RepID=A0A3D0W7R6_9SPHN|nr:hypothetical protein [Sphingomonas bacterium]
MCRIPHTRRRNGRYVFRRRVHFRNLISRPVAIALGTADPKVARYKASLLSACFVRVKASVEMDMKQGRRMTGTEIEALFRAELEAELRFYVHSAYEDAPWSDSVPEVAAWEAEAYNIARLPGRRHGLLQQDRDALTRRGLERNISTIEEYARQIREALDDEAVIRRLKAIDAPVHSENIEAARTHLIRAAAAATTQAQRVFDPDVMDAADPIQALMAYLGPVSDEVQALLKRPIPAALPSVVAGPADGMFLAFDQRRFSEVIDQILRSLKADGVWKGDLRQQRHIMETFAWITGDKALGSYGHLDVETFKQGLQQLPKRFDYGSLSDGAMSRPFREVLAGLPPLAPGDRRSAKTTNRDLSTMATVARHLAKTSWKSRLAGAVILDFGGARVAVKADPDIDTRPPWTSAHLSALFHSPIYAGGDGALRRLRAESSSPRVWHDAAYFAPLLWFYTHACREEICGLEVTDVVTGHPVPHIFIRDNATRGKDGEKAGEKRLARRRRVPIHSELRRLGFIEYVEAIRAEGHQALFPELFVSAEKRGGGFFYDRAWRHMTAYIGQQMNNPVNAAGKSADIHSIRALGSSFYELDGVNAILRADLFGHAREGTNARHYSKRERTEGLNVVLKERLAFIERYVPILTGHIEPWPVRLLPIEERSRVGSPLPRKRRSDAGTGTSRQR